MFNHRFSLVMEEIKSKERRLFEVEALRQNDSLNEDLWKEFVALKCSIRCLRRKEAMNAYQKFHAKWLRLGDCNSKFSHMIYNSRMRSNSLQSISVKGEVYSDPYKAKGATAEFFREHFQSSREIEIQSVVWCCGEDRAPGPDGLNFKILKQNWNVIKDDMIRFFEEFRAKGCFPKALNNSFITLIPKKLCPQDLNDFRPISLISSMYKVLAKVLEERLKSVMELVVGTSQFAFIKNRQILDCILDCK
ncbi:cysteine-rich receptor-like protein kinase [Tanacetum coccineum]